MAPRSKIDLLEARAPEVYEELNRRLVGSAFGNSVELSEWLRSVGWDIGKTAVNEHSQWLRGEYEKTHQKRLLRVEMAKALRGMSAEDKALLLENAEMQALDAFQDEMEEWAELDKAARLKNLPNMMLSIARLGERIRHTADWQERLQEAADRKAMEKAAAKTETVARKAGLSAETVQELRREILGIAA